jgi:pyruvate formate lyase activating enzyme
MTVYEVMNTLLKDKIFYENSSGGVTISGGDPLLQHEFALAILASCKDHGIHTAIETCLAAEWEILERFIPVVDLFIVDLKLFDSMQHQHFTGYLNDGIKQNYKRLVSTGVDLLTRVPLIPGATATKENIESLAVFISKYNPGGKVELMNFNPLAQSKYNLMDQNNEFLKGKKPYKPEELQQFNAILEKYSLQLIKEHQS